MPVRNFAMVSAVITIGLLTDLSKANAQPVPPSPIPTTQADEVLPIPSKTTERTVAFKEGYPGLRVRYVRCATATSNDGSIFPPFGFRDLQLVQESRILKPKIKGGGQVGWPEADITKEGILWITLANPQSSTEEFKRGMTSAGYPKDADLSLPTGVTSLSDWTAELIMRDPSEAGRARTIGISKFTTGSANSQFKYPIDKESVKRLVNGAQLELRVSVDYQARFTDVEFEASAGVASQAINSLITDVDSNPPPGGAEQLVLVPTSRNGTEKSALAAAMKTAVQIDFVVRAKSKLSETYVQGVMTQVFDKILESSIKSVNLAKEVQDRRVTLLLENGIKLTSTIGRLKEICDDSTTEKKERLRTVAKDAVTNAHELKASVAGGGSYAWGLASGNIDVQFQRKDDDSFVKETEVDKAVEAFESMRKDFKGDLPTMACMTLSQSRVENITNSSEFKVVLHSFSSGLARMSIALPFDLFFADASPSLFDEHIGMIVMWSGTLTQAEELTKRGWLVCNGRPVSRATYSRLLNVIGASYGAGDQVTTFNLPNFVNVSPVGASSDSGSRAMTSVTGALTASGGESVHKLTITEMPHHNHRIMTENAPKLPVMMGGGPGDTGNEFTVNDSIQQPGNPIITDYTGGDTPFPVLDPYCSTVFLIYAGE